MVSCQKASVKEGKQREKAEVCQIIQELVSKSVATGFLEWWNPEWSETMSLHPPVKHGEGSVKTDGIIKYKHILIYHVILSETLLIGFISQQENDPEHPANAVKAHMARKST